MDSYHADKLYDELSDELSEAIHRYSHQFGREEAARLLTKNIEYLYEQEMASTYDYFHKRSTSVRQLAKSSFYELLSLLRTHFMLPGSITFGSKVYIPDYGTCKVIHTTYGTVSFFTPGGDIDSSDIAFPVNHEIALRGGATLSDGCLVVYNSRVWKVVACSFEEHILDTRLDIARAEESGIGLIDEKSGLVKSSIVRVRLEEILIPKFMKNLHGETTDLSNRNFF